MTKQVVVVGAGIAGAACARELQGSGVPVRVLDRGRRPGGRMASRSISGRPVDLGASYLTVEDDGFREVVDDWHARGRAHPWTRRFTVLPAARAGGADGADGADGDPHDKEGPLRWGAAGGLRSLVEDLLDTVEVSGREVARVSRCDGTWWVDDQPAAAVVLAMPDPQAARLVDLDGVPGREWEPVLALAATWPTRLWDSLSPGGTFHGAFVNDDDVLAFVADDGRRRGDDAPVLVAHSTPEFAAAHLADPRAAESPMTRALVHRLGLPDPEATTVHRWTFAKPTGSRDAAYHWADGLGLCGDGWGPTSRVETAWVSGTRLARAIVRDLG